MNSIITYNNKKDSYFQILNKLLNDIRSLNKIEQEIRDNIWD